MTHSAPQSSYLGIGADLDRGLVADEAREASEAHEHWRSRRHRVVGDVAADVVEVETLKSAPMLVIRGELSDLLSASTAAEMVARHPNARLHTAEMQGHAPLLEDEPTILAILGLIEACKPA